MKNTVVLSLILLIASFKVEAQNSTCEALFRLENTRNAQPTLDISQELGNEGFEFNREVVRVIKQNGGYNSLPIKASKRENHEEIYQRFKEALKHYFIVLKPLQVEIQNYLKNQQAFLRPEQERNNSKNLNHAQQRMKNELSGLIFRTHKFLSAIGIDHTLVRNNSTHENQKDTFYIVIARTGNHYINRIARRLYEPIKYKNGQLPPYKLDIVFDPASLLIQKLDGKFSETKTERKIILQPDIMISDSFFRHSIGFHEFIHNVTSSRKISGSAKPYDAEIIPEKISDSLKNMLGYYSKYLSLDELLAFRGSIRVYAHQAIMKSSQKGAVFENFETIKSDVVMQIQFSQFIHRIFSKLYEIEKDRPYHSNFPRDIRVITEDGVFRVRTQEGLRVEDTLAMSDFTRDLYMLIGAKLESASQKTEKEKLVVIKQITRVLGLPSVRKLEGNYPSRSEILELLEKTP
ncbi:MAG: hypothetical protein V4596_11050 [Bdellovibrionota bacterium]